MSRAAMALLVLFTILSRLNADAANDAGPVEIVAGTPAELPAVARVNAVPRGPRHHFVGYYGIPPWGGDGKLIACLEAECGYRLVRTVDKAAICLINASTGVLTRVAETSAWNLQQGAMIHWLPT